MKVISDGRERYVNMTDNVWFVATKPEWQPRSINPETNHVGAINDFRDRMINASFHFRGQMISIIDNFVGRMCECNVAQGTVEVGMDVRVEIINYIFVFHFLFHF